MERSLLYVYVFCNFGGVASVLKQRLPYLSAAGYVVDGLFAYDYGGKRELQEAGLRQVTITPDPMSYLEKEAANYDGVCIVDMPEVARSAG